MVDVPIAATLVPAVVGEAIAKVEHVDSSALTDDKLPVKNPANDRLGDSAVKELRASVDFTFNGTPAADFGSIAVLTPGLDLARSGASVQATHDVTLHNFANTTAFAQHEFNPVDMTAGQYLEISGVDLTDILGTTLSLRGRMVLKE